MEMVKGLQEGGTGPGGMDMSGMQDMMKNMMGGRGMPQMPPGMNMGNMMEMAQKMMGGGGMPNMMKPPPGMPKGMMKMGRR